MSVRCITWAWEIKGLQPAQKLVLMCLADQAWDDGFCFPGKHYIATRCGVSKRTVDSAISTLVERGLVRVKRRVNEQGIDTSNGYELQIIQRDLFQPDQQPAPKPARGADIAPQDAIDAKTGPARGAIDVPARGANQGAVIAPEPYKTINIKTVEDKPKPTGADFGDWVPSATLLNRCKTVNAKLTDEFLMSTVPEFITYAEKNWKRTQLDEKFIANANRQLHRSTRTQTAWNKPNGQNTNDMDFEALKKWVAENNAPATYPGESLEAYRDRMRRWIQAGRPVVKATDPYDNNPDPNADVMQLPSTLDSLRGS